MEIDDVRLFVAVVEAGGLTAAGARLGLTKSVVSRRLSRLEASVGAQLLVRTPRGARLSEAGLAFQGHAARIVEEADAAQAALAPTGELRGRLRVAAPISFAGGCFAPLLAEFAALHPHLEMQTAYSDAFVDLAGGAFDAALRIGFPADSSLLGRRIAAIPGRLVASPEYLGRRGRPRTLAELSQHDAVLQGGEAWPLRDGDRIVTVRPRGRFRADNGIALAAAAAAGLGIALLPAFLTDELVTAGRLTPLLPEHPMPDAGLFLMRPPGGRAPRTVEALTDFLAQRLSG